MSDSNFVATSIREELLRLTHQWPQILLLCLFGCFLGWAVSWLWPAGYRATLDLYVGLNIETRPDQPISEYASQAFKGGTDQRTLIDYKNWQMTNLNSLIFMDNILQDALEGLRAGDDYWKQVSPAQFRAMLRVYWRSAGKWRLAAQDRDALRAAQAIFAWQASILEYTRQAIAASRSLQGLVVERQANAAAHTQLLTKQAALLQVQSALQGQLDKIRLLPQNHPLDELDRWLAWQTIVQADLGPSWLPLADAFPDPSQPASSYVTWFEKAAQAIDQELNLIQSQVAGLETETTRLDESYAQALSQSMGLSTNLEIRAITTDLVNAPELATVFFTVTDLRPTGALILVGGSLGLLGWLLYCTIRLSRLEQPAFQKPIADC